VTLQRIIADAGYRSHNAPPTHRFRVYTSGQTRSMTEAIKREMKRRAAVEPVIGHNFRRLLACLASLRAAIRIALTPQEVSEPRQVTAYDLFTGD
jgi:hypothetical protein